ncbi:MAG: dehydrogenase [Candidatus Marinimicrobia bacterium]|nr:dehydrogenase [Candidatus Neomarinimicrobiota bacterium]|tara:strand:- start:22754 stop:24724 length:1971 start_codon:yes stop_codon:yes gene_type:complete
MLSNSKLKELFYYLKLPRYIEERMLILLRQGKISKWFSGIGQEAISVGTTFALSHKDYILPMHRNLGVFTTRNVDFYILFCQLFGKQDGFTQGRDRTFHFGTLEYNIIGMISHLAAMLPVANGLALSMSLRKQKRIVVSFTGDGSTSEGDFHEALNIASVWNLPIIFLVENNGYGLSTPVNEQYKCEKISDKAIGYGIQGIQIDGNNIVEVYDTIRKAKKDILRGRGPVLIEALTFRVRGHEEASGIKYVPKKMIDKWKKKDPILQFENYLLSKKVIDKKYIEKIENEFNKKILPVITKSLGSKDPASTEERELDLVYKKSSYKKSIKSFSETLNMRFVDAIKDCLYRKMDCDSNVLIMGQDIAEYGGVFKVTEGFLDKFGKDRVRNTPIIESGIIGTAMGLAIEGYKPIVEMQFADFVSVGFNQIVNNLAKTYYRWRQPVNVTLRLPTGGGIGAGPFHSQSNESWFFHVPGLKLVYPSNPVDAKGLLLSSIDDENPVLFFEHKALYRSLSDKVPVGDFHTDLGKAKIIQHGDNLTIVSYGMGIIWIKDFINKNPDYKELLEVIDLRTLLPWDKNTILQSIKKTNKLLIINEDNITGSISGEISAYIAENAFEYLDAPILRLGSLDTPIPFFPSLEKEIYFPINKIEESIKKLIEY